MPFAVTWIQLETIIRSRRKKANTMILLKCGIQKCDTKNFTRTETDSREQICGFKSGKGRNGQEVQG